MVWFSWFHFSVWFAECSIRINWICWLKPGWVEFIQFNRKANKGKTRSNGAKNGLLEFGLIFNLIFTLFCLLISEVQSLTSEMEKANWVNEIWMHNEDWVKSARMPEKNERLVKTEAAINKRQDEWLNLTSIQQSPNPQSNLIQQSANQSNQIQLNCWRQQS